MISLNKKQSGFTIVELLIVIVVIGILAALVITTFAGVQRRARNTERETDVKAIHGQVEAYYANNGFYPAVTGQLNTDTWVQTNLKGLDLGALRPPNVATNALVNADNGNTAQYYYIGTGCTGTAPNEQCTGYTLGSQLENTTTDYTKASLN